MNKNKMVAPHCSENLNSMIFTTIYCQYFIRNINDFIICRLFFTPTNIDFWQSPKFFHRYICWAYLMSPVRDGVISKPKFDIFNLLRVLTSQKFPIVICSPYRLNNTTEDFLFFGYALIRSNAIEKFVISEKVNKRWREFGRWP